jgi:hypothetical protein
MRHLMTAILTATLGGACSSPSTRAATPTAPHDHEHQARHHDHEHVRLHDGHGSGGPHHAFADADALTRVFDDPTRDDWQRPDDVLRALELEPTMTVAYLEARCSRQISSRTWCAS